MRAEGWSDDVDLRDYFAAKAMQVYLAEQSGVVQTQNGEKPIFRWKPNEVAEFAYEMAAHMIKARKV